MQLFRPLNKLRSKVPRSLLISRLLRLLNWQRLKLQLKRLSKRSSDSLLKRRLKELPLKTREKKHRLDKLFKRPLPSKLDFKPSRMKKMLSKLLSRLRSKEERMRRRLPLKLLRLRDSESRRLLPRPKKRDFKLSLMLKKQDLELLSWPEENKLDLSNKPLINLEPNKLGKRRRLKKLLKLLPKLSLLRRSQLLNRDLMLLEQRLRKIVLNTRHLSKLNMSSFNRESLKKKLLLPPRLLLNKPSREWNKLKLLLML